MRITDLYDSFDLLVASQSIITLALPSAAAQTPTVTALTRAAVVHGVVPQRVVTRLPSSVFTAVPCAVETLALPTAIAVKGVVIELALPGRLKLAKFTPGKSLACKVELVGPFITWLQYWTASCATPT